MRHIKKSYLNVILTANALLLAGLLWTQWSGSSAAWAQTRTYSPPPPMIPNAAKQRNDIISSVNELRKSVDALSAKVESGRLAVRVTNLGEIDLNP